MCLYMRTFLVLILVIGIVGFAKATPLEELKSFSGFKNIDVQKLEEGEIVLDQMKIEDINRAIGAQACYIIKEPSTKVSKLLEKWETCHVQPSAPYFHAELQSPLSEDSFANLKLPASDKGIEWLINKTRDTKHDDSEFNLSQVEAKLMSETMKGEGNIGELAASSWKRILFGRAKQFFDKGLEGLAPIETGDEVVEPGTEFNDLLSGLPKIKEHFDSFIRETLFRSGSNQKGQIYWELLNSNQHGTFNLGALYYKYEGEKFKALNCDCYISSETYVSCTLYQLWPIEVSGKPATLIWRGAFASSPRLAQAKGVERMAAKQIMIKDLRKEIESFRKDIIR